MPWNLRGGKAGASCVPPLVRQMGRLASASLILTLFCFTSCAFHGVSTDALIDASAAAKYDVTIYRDSWGVPHIFGETDAAAAFGLAYAHAEDDLANIQEALLATRGELARERGMSAAPIDFMVRLFRMRKIVKERYQSDLSGEARAVCEAYADGINTYAALHPGERIDYLYPVTGQDVIAGFVLKTPFFFNLDGVMRWLMREEKPDRIAAGSAEETALASSGGEMWQSVGSNAFAISPLRTADGSTFFSSNSHQPWHGPLAWYEAHVHSEEGWDMVGGLFPGMPVIALGHNRHLGWSHTVNDPDLVDVYELEVNSADPNQYRFDGEWRELEVFDISIKVKLWGPVQWTVHREGLWSVHGPVMRRPHGTYAIRYAGHDDVRSMEQWYRMNKATSLQEFVDAMEMMAVPSFNTVYGDKEGNIFYLYNALFPQRDESFDWQTYLPGNTSDALWTSYASFSDLPQILNPSSGFVQSCNSSPFQTTVGSENPDSTLFSSTFGIERRMTNRALRALELFGEDSSITFEEFVNNKYDMSYSEASHFAKLRRRILDSVVSDEPLVREALGVLESWDLGVEPDNRGAALAIIAAGSIGWRRFETVTEGELAAIIRESAKYLKDNHGRIDVPWHDVNRLIRGDLNIGLGGGPDILHAVYGRKSDSGIWMAGAGDSFILMAAWDSTGAVSSRSIHQFGSATQDESSPHYSDQAPLFAQRKLKPVWMDLEDIVANLERAYRPGEEK